MKNQNKKKDTKNKRNKTAASGGRRDLQDDTTVPDLGYVVINTNEDITIYNEMEGVHAESDGEVHIDDAYYYENSYNKNKKNGVKKVVDGNDLNLGKERRLQESIPWGIEFVNVTGLWGVSSLFYVHLSFGTCILYTFFLNREKGIFISHLIDTYRYVSLTFLYLSIHTYSWPLPPSQSQFV